MENPQDKKGYKTTCTCPLVRQYSYISLRSSKPETKAPTFKTSLTF